jgi:hypothetical protein
MLRDVHSCRETMPSSTRRLFISTSKHVADAATRFLENEGPREDARIWTVLAQSSILTISKTFTLGIVSIPLVPGLRQTSINLIANVDELAMTGCKICKCALRCQRATSSVKWSSVLVLNGIEILRLDGSRRY